MSSRPAVPDDAARLAAVARRAITVTGATVYDADQVAAWSSTFTESRVGEFIATTSVFVVEADGEVAGWASLAVRDDGRAEVDQLYVDPGFAGHGVARVAITAVEDEARARGITELWADASLLAAPVFEHLGYAVVQRYDKRRGAVTFPNTWLTKPV